MVSLFIKEQTAEMERTGRNVEYFITAISEQHNKTFNSRREGRHWMNKFLGETGQNPFSDK